VRHLPAALGGEAEVPGAVGWAVERREPRGPAIPPQRARTAHEPEHETVSDGFRR
jgi:hypothetical protein